MKATKQLIKSLCVLTFFLSAMCCFNSSAQIAFKKKYQRSGTLHEANKIIETNDGGFLIAGNADGATGVGFDIWLIKLNIAGDTLWTKLIGGSNNDTGLDVEQTHDDGYIVTGLTESFGAGNYDIYLIRLDSLGNLLWAKTYGEVGIDVGYAVEQTPDLGFIVAGQLQYPASGNIDGCVLKVDSLGNVLWSELIGATFPDQLSSITKTSNGNYLIGGVERVSNTVAHILLINMNDAGDTLWTKRYDMGGYAFNPVSKELNNSFLISGSTTQSPSTFNDFFALNIDSTGNVNWAKLYPVQNDDYCSAIELQQSGNYILSGFSSPAQSPDFDITYITIDDSGNVLNTRIFPSSNMEISNSSVYTTQGCYAAVASELDFSTGNQTATFSKTDSLLNPACGYRDTVINSVNISPQNLNPFLSISSWSGGNAFVPNVNSGLTDSTVCAVFTDISNPISILVPNVFPNPFDDYVQININKKSNYKTTVLDIVGKEIISTTTNSMQIKLEMKGFVKGIYLLSITSKEDTYYQKLIKR